ncbi:hypothetical protein ACWC10_00035 [Streptomyces sp. NPDC001595]|uniref:hypothetical protein n=1 Tax=Streptomyces sp. NPDC001532 TaxID=3154520 RepID=UPI003332C579
MPSLTCESCGRPFYQHTGRPAKRCKDCRSSRYGPEHRRLVEQTRDAAYGNPCARCGKTMHPGESIDLDHADDGSGYLGWAHASCNRRQGAINGNRARAAAYRRTKGLPDPPQRDAGQPSSAVLCSQVENVCPPVVGSLHLIPGWDGEEGR